MLRDGLAALPNQESAEHVFMRCENRKSPPAASVRGSQQPTTTLNQLSA
jgi:hypothetical protein